MHKRKHLSLLVALFLLVASVAPLAVESGTLSSDEETIVSTYDADGVDQPRKKGNGFVRAISAPFRALGRLFGGKKKSKDEAKKRQEAARTETTAAASAPRAGDLPAQSPALEARAAAGPATAASSPARSEGARIVRPVDGQTVLPKTPKWIPVIEGIGKDPLTQGRALLQHGYLNEAISELSVAATIGPDLIEANNLLGLAYSRLGAHQQAVEAYERALSVAPEDPQVLNNLGHALFLNNQNAEALKRLKQAEKRAPGAPYVLNNIALVQARMGKFSDAFKSFTRAFGEYDARLKIAEMLEQAGRLDEAIKHYVAAVKIQPNSPALLERLAELYDRTGRQREAEATRRTLGKPPNKQKTATGGGG